MNEKQLEILKELNIDLNYFELESHWHNHSTYFQCCSMRIGKGQWLVILQDGALKFEDLNSNYNISNIVSKQEFYKKYKHHLKLSNFK